jgi:hypothetical protein
MAFESLGSLFHGFGGGGPYGYEHPSESVVNNYYDNAGNEHHADDSSFYNPEHDASRQDSSALADQSSSQDFTDTTDNSGNDVGSFGGDNFVDNSGFDDSGFDDSGSNFDNGGGGDNSSF